MSLEYYRGMLIQTPRMEAFRKHIHTVVRPGDRVLEIGAGLGTYSFFAAEAGAAKVIAVEGGSIIAVAKSVARANDLFDKVEFVRGWYPRVQVPSPIDVVIFEDYPSRLLDSSSFSILRHLHNDVLKPGVRLVPNRAKMYVAPVFSKRNWRVVGPFGDNVDTDYGVDWTASREYVYNTPLHMPLAEEDVRHDAMEIADIRLDAPPNASTLIGSAEWEFKSATTIHGLAYWFEFEVGDGVWLSNAPGAEPGSWGNLFLPVSEPWELPIGSVLNASVGPEVKEKNAPGWLKWELSCGDRHFSGHEFKSFAASLDDIISISPSWIPELSDEGRIERQILNAADGQRSVDEIAKTVRESIPRLSDTDIRSYVAQVLKGRTKNDLAVKQQ